MSSPFIYSPHSEYFHQFQRPCGYWTRPYDPSFTSPFVPNEPIYPSSPYTAPSDIASPNTPERPFFSGINGGWANTPRPIRRRRLSWHGTTAAPTVSPFIPPPPLPASLEDSGRRLSWGNTEPPVGWPSHHPPMGTPFSAPPPLAPAFSAQPYGYPYVPGYPQFPGDLHIHPWLNGDMPSELYFDLSETNFSPRRLVGPEESIPLTLANIQPAAFYPSVTKLRIVCDMIPNWPIDLVYSLAMPAPPITVGDILVAIHQKMHQKITHLDWERLSGPQTTLVSRAFTRRCRMESIRRRQVFRSDLELPERQQGVKVVDFLLGKTIFRGLVRSEDGFVKMIVTEP